MPQMSLKCIIFVCAIFEFLVRRLAKLIRRIIIFTCILWLFKTLFCRNCCTYNFVELNRFYVKQLGRPFLTKYHIKYNLVITMSFVRWPQTISHHLVLLQVEPKMTEILVGRNKNLRSTQCQPYRFTSKMILYSTSVTRSGDLSDFDQLLNAFGNT